MKKRSFFQHKILITFILVFLIFSANMIVIDISSVSAANPTDFINDAEPGFYLRYEEEITLTWEDYNWKNKKVGETIRKITISEIGENKFTIREDLNYSMHLPTDLDYAYVDLENIDGEREELDGGARGSISGDVITYSIYAYYTVKMDTGEVLEFKLGGLENQDESDLSSEIPQELEHYWSYIDSTTNTQVYAWDVVGFPYKDSLWGYFVEPEMKKGKKFDDNKWAVNDPVTYKFDGQTQDCMNITGTWKDETDEEVLAEWKSKKICDKDTGLKLTQSWNGNCKVQVYDLETLEWSLRDEFEINVEQKLTDTSFRMQTREHPFSTIEIKSPNQGAFLGDTVNVRVQVFNVHDTSIDILDYYFKSSTAEDWTHLESHSVLGEAPNLWYDELEIDVSLWTGKYQIKVVGKSFSDFDMFNIYSDIVDVFLKPVYIDNLDVKILNQHSFGPHIDGGLNRVPYEVSFNLNVREDLVGDPTILIDCWYLPFTGSFWSEEIGETINLEEYWGGDAAYQSVFKSLYADRYSGVDPIVGTQKLDKKEFTDERLQYINGGSYKDQGFNYTISSSAVESQGAVQKNKATSLPLKKGETANFNFGLYFINPGNQSHPKIRLYSLEVLVDYEIIREGEKQSFTEKSQKNIAVRTTEPVATPYDHIVEGISAAFSPNNLIGYTIEQVFGEEYAQAAYQGNYVRYLYYLAMGLDTTIRNAPTSLSYFGILTGPYWAAVVGTVSLATGVPLPTSWLDLATEVSARAYASVPKEDRVGIWYLLLQAAAGVQETNVFDPKPLVDWTNVISVDGQGELLNTTLRWEVDTYEVDNKYYLDFNLTNIGDYPARFITVYIKGDPANFLTRHEFLQMDIAVNERAFGENIYIGSKDGSYRFDVYFISKPDGISPPVFSKTRGNPVWTPSREFDLPVISEAITAFSPVDVHVYDQNDNHVGVDSNGDIELEIPGSWYSGKESSPETVILSKNNLKTRVEVVGKETGTYKLNFQRPMTVTDRNGEASVIITSFTLSNVKISEGQKQTYNYDFNILEEEINQLTTTGWNVKEAVNYVFSNIDTDEDEIPDIIDEDPLQKKTSTDLGTIGITAGAALALVIGALYYFRLRKPKTPKYKKLDEF